MAGSGLTLNSKPKGELKAYEPSLRDKLAWLLSDAFGGGDRSRVNYINEKVRGAADLAPVVGDMIGAEETKTAFDEGRYGDAALSGISTAVGAIPGGGDLLAAGLKGGANVAGILSPVWRELYHGTASSKLFDKPEANMKDLGLHLSDDPSVASAFSGGIVAGGNSPRIYPVLADTGKSFNGIGMGMTDPMDWRDPQGVAGAMQMGVLNRHSQSIVDDLISGMPTRQAFETRGYDSIDFPVSDYWTLDEDNPDRSATLLFDSNRVVPKFSPEGMRIKKYKPAGKELPPAEETVWQSFIEALTR